MERFNALGRGAQLMLIGGVLLLIDLFLPWQDFDVGGLADELGVDASFSGWRGFGGVILGLLTIVLLAWLIVRLASVDIPLPVSTAMTGALLGVLILIFAVIKMLSILGDEQTIWAWIGLLLAVVIAVGAFQVVQEAGGVDQLKSEIPSRPAASESSGTAQTPPPAATTPPAEAAPAPSPPVESPPTSEPGGTSETGGGAEVPTRSARASLAGGKRAPAANGPRRAPASLPRTAVGRYTFGQRVNRSDPLLEDDAPERPLVERLKSLSRGEIVVVVAAALLVVDLFLTWQNLEVDFGPQGTATSKLDGWDAWGLLIALTSIGLIVLVLVVYVSEIEVSADVRWELWILVGAIALFVMTLAKNLTDADSAWASYVGVVLAGVVVVGASMIWGQAVRQRKRFTSSTRSSPGPS